MIALHDLKDLNVIFLTEYFIYRFYFNFKHLYFIVFHIFEDFTLMQL